MILVLGASGYIGNNLYNKFMEEEFNVVGTYFKNKINGMFYFDICNMDLDKIRINTKTIHINYTYSLDTTTQVKKPNSR